MIRFGWPKDSSLRKINRGLLLCCILVNGYLVFAPLMPQASYIIETKITKPVKVDVQKPDTLASLDRSTNRVIVPGVQIEETIFESQNESALSKGIWHRPRSSTPDKGGNTVLAGHRFTYQGEAPFYRLDKVAIGDPIVVVYGGKVYRYQVRSIQTVRPTQVSVENNTEHAELTLYTCTPLWSYADRLVLKASLEETL